MSFKIFCKLVYDQVNAIIDVAQSLSSANCCEKSAVPSSSAAARYLLPRRIVGETHERESSCHRGKDGNHEGACAKRVRRLIGQVVPPRRVFCR